MNRSLALVRLQGGSGKAFKNATALLVQSDKGLGPESKSEQGQVKTDVPKDRKPAKARSGKSLRIMVLKKCLKMSYLKANYSAME